MSLEDLEKRAILAPVEAELDRQKEKAAKFKKERDAAWASLRFVQGMLAGLATERMTPYMLVVTVEALKAIGEQLKESE